MEIEAFGLLPAIYWWWWCWYRAGAFNIVKLAFIPKKKKKK